MPDWAWHPVDIKGVKYHDVCLDAEQLSTGRGGVDLNRVRLKTIDCYGRQTSIMHRGFVCNSVLFPSSWYTAKAVPCAFLEILTCDFRVGLGF